MRFRDRPRPAPVRVGEELEVTIEAVGEKGDGVAKKDGFVLFVPNVQEGERVRIKVTKVLRKVGFAEKIGEGGAAEPVSASEPGSESFDDSKESEPSEDFGEEPEASESEDFDESADEEPEASEDFGDSESDDELSPPEPPSEE